METEYLSTLKNELNYRTEINPSYSLRAFARDLGVSASTISEIFSGKHKLSLRNANRIVGQLNLSELEKENFIDQVALEHSVNKQQQKILITRIKRRSKQSHGKLPLDLFKVISDWQHFAILELTNIKGFRSCEKWVADQLGLNEEVITESVERLEKIGAIRRKKGEWTVQPEFQNNFVGYDVPSEAIKKFHKQIIHRIFEKVYTPIETREFSSTLLPLTVEEYKLIKKNIKKFKNKLFSQISDDSNKDDLYMLGIQLVPVTKNITEDGSA